MTHFDDSFGDGFDESTSSSDYDDILLMSTLQKHVMTTESLFSAKRRRSVDCLFDTILFDDGADDNVELSSSDSDVFDLTPADPTFPITAPQLLAALSQATKLDPHR